MNKQYIYPCCNILFLACFHSFGQNGTETFPSGARSMGLANTNVTIDDGWSVFNNVGAMGRLETTQAFFSYDHRLGINELTTLAAGTAVVNNFGVLGLSLSHYGGELFNQQNIGLAFSNSLGIASFGVKVNYFQTNIEGFGRNASPVLEFGGMATLNPGLFFGAHIYNFTRAKLSKISHDYLPTVIKAGISYHPSDKLMINVEAEKEIILPPQLKTGIEYNLLNRLWARSGIHTNPRNLFFGMGFKPKRYHIDYALSQNYQLGYTHHFSFNYLFNMD
ncbi:MAG: hypothetical protein WD426_20455 [Anditalea sp.]